MGVKGNTAWLRRGQGRVAIERGVDAATRGFAMAASALALLLLAPTMLAMAGLVKLTSKGPVFSAAPRASKDGRFSVALKFRSTRTAIDRFAGSHITPVGRFMRRYSLDSLPQLIDVLRGR